LVLLREVSQRQDSEATGGFEQVVTLWNWADVGDAYNLKADPPAALPPEFADRFPHLAEIAGAASHDDQSVVGPGCDDQFEFEFALDLLLDGIERLHQQGWTSPRRGR